MFYHPLTPAGLFMAPLYSFPIGVNHPRAYIARSFFFFCLFSFFKHKEYASVAFSPENTSNNLPPPRDNLRETMVSAISCCGEPLSLKGKQKMSTETVYLESLPLNVAGSFLECKDARIKLVGTAHVLLLYVNHAYFF